MHGVSGANHAASLGRAPSSHLPLTFLFTNGEGVRVEDAGFVGEQRRVLLRS